MGVSAASNIIVKASWGPVHVMVPLSADWFSQNFNIPLLSSKSIALLFFSFSLAKNTITTATNITFCPTILHDPIPTGCTGAC